MAIVRLSQEVIQRLRSGVSAPDVCTCVLEIVCNALDAQATSITVRVRRGRHHPSLSLTLACSLTRSLSHSLLLRPQVDLRDVRFSVSDNGTGMEFSDLQVAGRLYHTSKAQGLADLADLQVSDGETERR